MRTSRPVAEKLGTVRQDPDLHGLLFTLISRATDGRQERAARACRHLTTGEGRGLRHRTATGTALRGTGLRLSFVDCALFVVKYKLCKTLSRDDKVKEVCKTSDGKVSKGLYNPS